MRVLGRRVRRFISTWQTPNRNRVGVAAWGIGRGPTAEHHNVLLPSFVYVFQLLRSLHSFSDFTQAREGDTSQLLTNLLKCPSWASPPRPCRCTPS